MENLHRFYLGIFLISLATLLFETSLVRIFSVTLFSPFAFLIISSALFGFGLGGVYLSLFRRDPGAGRNLQPSVALLALGFALAVLIGLVTIVKLPFRISLVTTDPAQLLVLFLHYIVLVLPFLFAGTLIALLLSRVTGKVSTLYFFDLLGAALGAILTIPLLPLLAGPGLILTCCLIALWTAAWLGFRSRSARLISSLVLLVLLGLVVQNAGRLQIQTYEAKREFNEALEDGKIVYSKWTAISRIDVADQPEAGRKKIFIDGGTYVSVLLPFNGDFAEFRANQQKSWTLPYRLKRGADVLVIGSGGGREVLAALSYGAASVTAVELDPVIVDLVKNDFHQYLGGLFSHPRVRLVNDEGRSFIQRTDETYDVIQQVNNNSPVAMGSGALNLSETYLLTVEAFHDFLDHLNEGGVLAITRPGAVKLAALAREVFDQRGITDGASRVVALRGDESDNDQIFLLKNGRFDRAELEAIRAFADRKGLEILFAPDTRDADNLFYQILTTENPDRIYERVPLNLLPPTDDRPFFNHMRKWSELGLDLSTLQRDLQGLIYEKTAHLPFDAGDMVLFVLLAEATVLAAVFILLPLYSFKRRGQRSGGKGRTFWYFAAIGVGFILVEISLMQRFVLFLGYPIYAITVVLFTLLVAAGVGSWLSRRFQPDAERNLARILAALAGLLVAGSFVLPVVFETFLDDPFYLRYLISVALLSVPGLLMGMPFPLGIRITGDISPALIPWAWGINGYATVVGSVLSVVGAMTLGFNAVLLLAAGVYLSAAMALGSFRSGPHRISPQ